MRIQGGDGAYYPLDPDGSEGKCPCDHWTDTSNDPVKRIEENYGYVADVFNLKCYRPKYNEDGDWLLGELAGDHYVPDADSNASLEIVKKPDTYIFRDGAGNEEIVRVVLQGAILQRIRNAQGFTQTFVYEEAGFIKQLTQVSDSFGRTLHFEYGANGLLAALIDPAQQKTLYQYDTERRLVQVIRPDGGKTTYHYEDPKNFYLLTGITDALGKRYATWTYDEQARAVSSEHVGGVERVTLQFEDTAHRVSVSNAFGKTSHYDFQQIQGVPKPTTLEGVFCQDCKSQVSAYRYDERGYLTQIIDGKGIAQQRTFGEYGLLQQVTEATGTPQETTTQFTWHPKFKTLTERKQAGLTQFWGYNDRGLVNRVKTGSGFHNLTFKPLRLQCQVMKA